MDNMEELPPGYRFYPTEEELVSFYLRNKLEGKRLQKMERVIPVINIYNVEPFHLPSLSGERCKGDTEQWFFFTPRQEREASGGRANRTTASGYWKATGSPGHVYSSDNRVIGLKKTMVFYEGKAPLGRKTKWKMNEYRAIEEVTEESNITVPKLRHEFSLCRVYVVSGSFRAFDRRPLEVVQRETQLHHGTGSTSADASKTKKGTSSPETSYPREYQAGEISQGSKMVEAKSSPETSYSGGDQADAIPGITESTTMGMVDDLEPPEWEWDQLNWP